MKIVLSKRYKESQYERSTSTLYTNLSRVNPTMGVNEVVPVEYVVKWDSRFDGATGDLNISVVSVKDEKTGEELDESIKQHFNNYLIQEAEAYLREASQTPGESPEGWYL